MNPIFPEATVVHFKDGTSAPCDTDGRMLMSLLRDICSGEDTEIPVKYGRAVVLRPISEIDIDATWTGFLETAHVKEKRPLAEA